MQCPLCTIELNIYHQQGIEVDCCPKCRGGWLDRGELDKFIEYSSTEAANQSMPQLGKVRSKSINRGRFHGYPNARRFTNKRNNSLLRELYDD